MHSEIREAIVRIKQEHVDQLQREGHVLVKDFLTGEELREAQDATRRYFPESSEWLRTPERFSSLKRSTGFPYEPGILNHLSLHPELISFVERVLGTEDIRLGDSILQAKYGSRIGPAHSQQLHNDAWGRNTLVPPRGDGKFQRVFAILYYSDSTAQLGPTYAVPKKHTEGLPMLSSSGYSAYSKEEFAWLYELEEPVVAPAGSALLFTGTTVHRGSAVQEETGHRFAHFLNFHAADAIWLDKQTWVGSPASANGPALCRFIEEASPRQREMLGFPAADAPYWDETTVEGLTSLYPGMDVTPYVRA
jgi:hypothetical protein